jgi:adenylylsulfate kinase
MTEKTHVTWHQHSVSRAARERLNRHKSCVVWFTGLSGSGKSTIANLVDAKLHKLGVHTCLLDGDNVRHGLNAGPAMLAPQFGEAFARRFGLGFSPEDRAENIRRVAAVAELFLQAGIITLTAFVSPYRRDRAAARGRIEASSGQKGDFVEVYVSAPLEVCRARDPKGLYQKARSGEVTQFTGLDDPYEPPEYPELVLDSAKKSADALADEVVEHLKSHGYVGG